MKLLKRNLQEFEYLPYAGESDLDPETGLHTGEPVQTFGTPVALEGNISVPSQYVNSTFYGEDIRYTHTLVMLKPEDVKINTYGKIRWKDEEYEIRAVRESLNHLNVALRKRTAQHAESDGE